MLATVRNRLVTVLSLTLPCMAFATSALPVTDERVAVVGNLYRAFAWQALASPDDVFGKSLVEQDSSVLHRYFDRELALLLINDQRCIERTGELCNLDFDPIFASQDPAAADLLIRSITNNMVAVEFTYPSNGEKVRLEYRLTRSENGWRISDIRYPGKSQATLKQLLARKLPTDRK